MAISPQHSRSTGESDLYILSFFTLHNVGIMICSIVQTQSQINHYFLPFLGMDATKGIFSESKSSYP